MFAIEWKIPKQIAKFHDFYMYQLTYSSKQWKQISIDISASVAETCSKANGKAREQNSLFEGTSDNSRGREKDYKRGGEREREGGWGWKRDEERESEIDS